MKHLSIEEKEKLIHIVGNSFSEWDKILSWENNQEINNSLDMIIYSYLEESHNHLIEIVEFIINDEFSLAKKKISNLRVIESFLYPAEKPQISIWEKVLDEFKLREL